MKAVVNLRLERLMSGEEIADDIKLFVKPEPHKLAKIDEGRLRLISGVSMIDAIIDKMLFGCIFDQALRAVGRTPALVGWTPLNGGHRLILDQFPAGVVSVDKSAWDWSVPAWLVDIWEDFILEMFSGYPDWYIKLVRVRFLMLFERAVFKCGTERREQGVKGVMKSGCFLTLLLNSLGQIAVHVLACYRLGLNPKESMPYAYGDDTVQNACFDVESYAEELRKLGFKTKVQPVAKHIEFVGFLMDSERVVPAYWLKHLFRIKYLDEPLAIETLESLQLLYRDEPAMLNIVHHELRIRDPRKIKSSKLMKLLSDRKV